MKYSPSSLTALPGSADLRTGLHLTVYGNDTQRLVIVQRREYHALAFDAFQFTGSKIGNEANLLAHQFLGLVEFGDTAHNRAVFQPVGNLEAQQFVRFGHFGAFQHRPHTDVQLLEVLECDILADGLGLIVGFLVGFFVSSNFCTCASITSSSIFSNNNSGLANR